MNINSFYASLFLLTISKIGSNEKRNSVGSVGTFEDVMVLERDDCRLLSCVTEL